MAVNLTNRIKALGRGGRPALAQGSPLLSRDKEGLKWRQTLKLLLTICDYRPATG